MSHNHKPVACDLTGCDLVVCWSGGASPYPVRRRAGAAYDPTRTRLAPRPRSIKTTGPPGPPHRLRPGHGRASSRSHAPAPNLVDLLQALARHLEPGALRAEVGSVDDPATASTIIALREADADDHDPAGDRRPATDDPSTRPSVDADARRGPADLRLAPESPVFRPGPVARDEAHADNSSRVLRAADPRDAVAVHGYAHSRKTTWTNGSRLRRPGWRADNSAPRPSPSPSSLVPRPRRCVRRTSVHTSGDGGHAFHWC